MKTNTKIIDFSHAKTAIASQWDKMSKQKVFRTTATGEEMWETYLTSFPRGTNPMLRERTEHDCSCCRHFIQAMGNAISIVDGQVVSIWDTPCEEPAYATVFAALSALVKSKPISGPFIHGERQAGTDKNFDTGPDLKTITWRHFFVKIPNSLHMTRSVIPTKLGEQRSTKEVLERGLRELTMDSFETVLDMIGQNALYRGEEHKGVVERFRAIKTAFDALPEDGKDIYAWFTAVTESIAICRIRNMAIGTLLINLSEGMDLEDAVKAFESVVAPTNYKRPTALVTKAMIQKAREAVAALGLTEALERRHAVVEDLKVDDLLFVDRDTRAVINGDVFDIVAATAKSPQSKDISKLEEVPIERFIAEILPRAQSVEVLLENRHAANMVSLIAPDHKETGQLFKWPNPFSWSYNGEVADSIKERVKKAGGVIEADLCCRLAWSNHDDLDLHMEEADSGHIYYANRGPSMCGGMLDVDMNAGLGKTRKPVENIFYPNRMKMRAGNYKLLVNQFCKRESKDVGFEVEIDAMGVIHKFSHPETVRNDGVMVKVATIRVSKDHEIEVIPELKEAAQSCHSRKIWGIDTNQFHRVKAAMLSPNFWEGSRIGNQHLFLMLEACASDVPARGFYNEFLTNELDKHRKVLELVGSKTAITPADRQLSGLGFSSTQRAKFTCKVKGSYNRTIVVTI